MTETRNGWPQPLIWAVLLIVGLGLIPLSWVCTTALFGGSMSHGMAGGHMAGMHWGGWLGFLFLYGLLLLSAVFIVRRLAGNRDRR